MVEVVVSSESPAEYNVESATMGAQPTNSGSVVCLTN